jgi:transposase
MCMEVQPKRPSGPWRRAAFRRAVDDCRDGRLLHREGPQRPGNRVCLLRGRAQPAHRSHPAHPRRGAADCGQHREAAKQLYWLSDKEWRRIEPLLPSGRRGAHRVDDRRVISGIMHMLRSGARWRDCPPEYGPYTTIYNRFNRWSRQGIWLDMFKALTGSAAVFGIAAIDSSHVKAHRSAGGGKGGPSSKRSGARAAAARPRSTR